MRNTLSKAITAVLLLLMTSACSWLPLPYTVDLKDQLGSDTQGIAEHQIEAGNAGDIDIRHPDDGDPDRCIDFEEVDIPVTVQSARLHYNVTLDYEGPPLSGLVSAQLYLSNEASNRWLPSNKVGPQVTVNLSNADTRLAGTAVLNRDQVEGINAKHLCWGVQLSGNDVSAQGSGRATVQYEIHDLRLALRFSVI